MKKVFLTLLLVYFMSAIASAAIFEDDFESYPTGSFPDKWINFNTNADTVVVDDVIDPGTIYDGTKSARITFNGGSGSGIQTTFDPVTKGILTFHCSIDWASDDLQLMGLHNFSDTEDPGSHLVTVSAQPYDSVWEYSFSGATTGIPVVFGEYARFDLHFDTGLSTATLYINDAITNIVDFPFENPSTGVTTLRSIDDSGTGAAQWYLDNVTVTPEPATMLLIGLGGLFMRRRNNN